MRVLTDKFFKTLFAGVAAASLVACGGGGGADATVEDEAGTNVDGLNPVTLSVTATPASLPANSVYACPSTSSAYVAELAISAKTADGNVLPTGTNVNFSIESGTESGSVVYLDTEHTDTVENLNNYCFATAGTQVETLWRAGSISLGAGSAILYLYAHATPGTVSVKFSVVDPATNNEVVKTIDVVVN